MQKREGLYLPRSKELALNNKHMDLEMVYGNEPLTTSKETKSNDQDVNLLTAL